MSKKVTKSDLESTIEKLQAENTALRQRMVSSEANAKLTLKERDEQSASIASLKTELMAKCLEVAKLEGYITRANESDPEPASPTIRTFGAIERPPMTSVSYGANWSEPQTPVVEPLMDRPILFSGPMVRALLESRKTQTRRVITPQPDWDAEVVETKLFGLTWPIGKYGQQCGGPIALPRFAIGDRLYVREVCMAEELADGSDGVRYLADNAFLAIANTREAGDRWCDLFNYSGKRPSGRRGRKVPGMHMPRWASRLTLIVTDVRVQRLQAINEIDAWAEGVQDCGEIDGGRHISGHGKTLYANLWDHLNKDRAGGAYAWAANPWIVAVSFNVIKQNIDRVKP